ncbi:MAG: hypothetical protein WAM28_04040 [Chlamydiales bacterium]
MNSLSEISYNFFDVDELQKESNKKDDEIQKQWNTIADLFATQEENRKILQEIAVRKEMIREEMEEVRKENEQFYSTLKRLENQNNQPSGLAKKIYTVIAGTLITGIFARGIMFVIFHFNKD